MTEDDGYETIVPDMRSCTCHPSDNPPRPCPRKYAYTDCVEEVRQAAYNQALKGIEADIRYLVSLADWAAGQGLCQIDGIEDPEEWCYRKWGELGPGNGDGYSAEALASAVLSLGDKDNG